MSPTGPRSPHDERGGATRAKRSPRLCGFAWARRRPAPAATKRASPGRKSGSIVSARTPRPSGRRRRRCHVGGAQRHRGQDRRAEARGGAPEAELANSWKDRLLANVSHEFVRRSTRFSVSRKCSAIPSWRRKTRQVTRVRQDHPRLGRPPSVHGRSHPRHLEDRGGRISHLPEPFDVAPLIADCCDMLRLKAEPGKVELAQRGDQRAGELIAEKRACRQIVLNLVSNAMKFTEPAVGSSSTRNRRRGDAHSRRGYRDRHPAE